LVLVAVEAAVAEMQPEQRALEVGAVEAEHALSAYFAQQIYRPRLL